MNPYYQRPACGGGSAPAAGEGEAPGFPTEERIAVSEANLATPGAEDFDTEAMRGSMQQLLSECLGLYVICEFIVGTQGMLRKEGVLYNVGRSVLTLYDEANQDFIVCDIFSLKFVTFYLPNQRPGQISSQFPAVNVPGVGQVPAGPYGLGTGDTRPTVGRRSRMW